MRTSQLSRRLRAVAIPTLAVATGLLLAPTATAGVLDTPQAIAQLFSTASGTCTATGSNPATVTQPFTATGLPVTVTNSGSVTYTKTGNPSDVSVTNQTITNTVTATQANGALSSVQIHETFSATVSSALGTAQLCNAESEAIGGAEYAFDLPSPKYVTITVDAHNAVGEILFGEQPTNSTNEVEQIALADHTVSTTTLLLPAGLQYIGEQVGGGIAIAPTATDSTHSSRVGDSTIGITFQDPGTATAAQSGKGSKYLAFSASQNCGTHQVTATWTKKVGNHKHPKVKKAVFTVGTAKAASVKKPKKNQVTTINGVPLESSSVVTATIKLTNGKTVTVSRPYQACS